MKKNFFLFTLFCLFLVVFSFNQGVLWGKSQCKVCPPENIDLSLFWETYYKLNERFVDKSKINLQKIIYGAISGMVNSLEDPYTTFLTPQQTKIFEEDVKGTFEGVGMEIGIRKGKLQIIAPLEGTPAQRAGLKSGDVIVKIDDKSTEGMSLEEAVSLIRGPKDTIVKLTIFREGWEKEKEFEIKRDVIQVPSLKWEIKDEETVYLRIYQFSEKLPLDFQRAASEILKGPQRKMVLDLRDNPGGYLEVANNIAGWFLEKGKVVVIEDFGNGQKKEYKSEGPSRFLDYKIVVIINKGTASAAEILAGALKDHLGIILVGEQSFGKGSVQEMAELSDGSSLKITIARWLTPSGKLIAEVGLEPDIKVEMTEKDISENKDPQLEKAIEILKAL